MLQQPELQLSAVSFALWSSLAWRAIAILDHLVVHAQTSVGSFLSLDLTQRTTSHMPSYASAEALVRIDNYPDIVGRNRGQQEGA